MKYQPLTEGQKEAGRQCLTLLDVYELGVQGAIWIYTKSLQEWRFYIVTSLLDIDGLVETYNSVERSFGLKFRNEHLTMEDIHFSSPTENLFMKLASAISARAHSEIELDNVIIDGFMIEHAYIYRLEKAPPKIKAKQVSERFDKMLKQIE
jgi:hypothetical protein